MSKNGEAHARLIFSGVMATVEDERQRRDRSTIYHRHFAIGGQWYQFQSTIAERLVPKKERKRLDEDFQYGRMLGREGNK